MIALLGATLIGLMRLVAVTVLTLLVGLTVIGFAFLAFAGFIGADVHVRGGVSTLAVQGLVLALCLYGLHVLARPRALQP